MIDKDTVYVLGFLGGCVGFGWLAYKWIDSTLIKPVEKLVNEAIEMKKEQANIKELVAKISMVQEARTGEVAPIQELVHSIHENVQHLADITDAKFMLANQALFTCDNNGFLSQVNEEFIHITGIKKEDAIGMKWLAILNDDQQDIFLRQWEKLLKHGLYLSGIYHGSGVSYRIKAVKKPEKTNEIKIILGTIEKL